MRLSQQLQVLNRGQILASGTPEEIQANPDVIAAYLGTRRRGSGDA
jgi:ABC-type branched-subunit amino acid transport system ATPase component